MRLGRVRTVLAALVVAGAVAGCSSNSHVTAPDLAASSALSAPSTTSSLAWGRCAGHYEHTYQCATLTVPLDYSGKVPGTLKLALIRTPATDPSQRIGSLLINPGGPGESTVADWDFLSGTVDAALHRRFDVVGFDPRGVGESTAVNCLSTAQTQGFTELDFAPTTTAETNALVAGASEVAARCEATDGSLLPFIGTANAARDMDRIRGALGDAKLTYLGFSYGTLLGATYAQEFPTRVRALVLDGAENPSLTAVAASNEQSAGFQRQLDRFLTACAAASNCPWKFSESPGAAFSALMTGIAATPLPAGSRKLYSGQAFFGVGAALYDQASWPALETALAEAAAGNGAGLLALSDDYTERNADGTYSNVLEANTAIDCRDYAWPRGAASFLAAAHAALSAAPAFGAANLDTSLPCAFWPADASGTGPPGSLRAVGAPPILVVATTGDPATPYADGVALAHQLASGVLVTNVGEQHTAYGSSACVRAISDAYLITAVSPGPQRCDDEGES